jgi:polyisoprenoid-binding protein YceI
MRRIILIVVAVAVLAAVLVGGWYFFIRDDPAELTLPEQQGTQQASSAGDLAGTWQPASTSVAGYRVREKLASLPAQSDAVGRTSEITGEVTLAADNETLTATAANFEVDVTTLESDQSRRDNAIKTRGLQTEQFPTATFALSSPAVVPQAALAGGRATVNVTGDLTLHGQTKSVTIPLEVQLNEGRIELDGDLTFPFTDFGMEPPTIGGIVSVEDEATLEFTLVLTKGT